MSSICPKCGGCGTVDTPIPQPNPSWDEAIEAARLAITELDCMYVTQGDVITRHEYGGTPADPESSIFREVVKRCEAAVSALRNTAPSGAEKPASLTYTNYRGETSVRSIVPRYVRFGSTEWHPEPQWLLLAYDTEKNADREFALKDFGHPIAADSNASAEARWKKKFKGRPSGGAWIHTHSSIDRAIVENHHGFMFNGVVYASLNEAKEAALSTHPNASDCARNDWDGLDCGCGGGWKVGHRAGCPEADSESE